MKLQSTQNTDDAAADSGDRVGHIERRGISFVPDSARKSRPVTVGVVFFGAQFNYGALILGALPVAFGLSLWASVSVILLGTLLGTAGFAAMVPIGSRSGTNATVSSGAFFGIRGRYIGSLITQIVDLGYFALNFWISAPPLVAASHRLFGTPIDGAATAVALVITVLGVLGLAVFGHATIVAYEKLTAVAGVIAIMLLVLFTGVNFTGQHNPVPHYALGSFWPTWTMALTVQISNAISYGPFASDYSRYVPSKTSARSLYLWAFGGMFTGCMVGLGAGAFIGVAIADPYNLIGGMIGFLPFWLVMPVTLISFFANTTCGSLVVYNGILNMHGMFWRLKWLQVSAIFGVLGIALACTGLIVTDFAARIDALCSVVTILVTPWMMINVIGYLQHRGRFDTASLQDFDHRNPDNIYWYQRGWNLRALTAWVISTAIGILFSDTRLFVGPLANVAGGADLSFASSALVGVVLYLALAPKRNQGFA